MSWESVYKLTREIPRGRVTTYGTLAKALRLPGGARAAGHAMAASPSGRGIPWHRVVAAGGRLVIREPHASLQRKLLEGEGIDLSRGRVDMRRYGWMPPKLRPAPKPVRRKRRRFARSRRV